MRITFYGAARSVTGSRHLIEACGHRVLLDCGLMQGRRKETYERNWDFRFQPREVDAVVLSHAHIDHSGNLPNLVKRGFAGKIHATEPTVDLAGIMLRDCAHILERDVEYLNKRYRRRGISKVAEPLYRTEDAELALRRFDGHPDGSWFPVVDGVTARFRRAGHIVGAAIVELKLIENGRPTHLVFSGDIGGRRRIILKGQERIEQADVLIMESTYGDRVHDATHDIENKLVPLIKRCVGRGGKIIIPAFAVGRAQLIAWALKELFEQHRIPEIQVFVDSPMTNKVTETFMRHRDCFQDNVFNTVPPDSDPFGLDFFSYTHSVEDSKRLNSLEGPAVILSASGMCEAGRILHHLKNHLPNPANAVLFVGYQAEGTLGRRILEGAKEVKIFGEPVVRRAEVVVMNTLSAHGDRDDLMEFVAGFDAAPATVFVVHGEESQALPLAQRVRKANPTSRVEVPALYETFEL